MLEQISKDGNQILIHFSLGVLLTQFSLRVCFLCPMSKVVQSSKRGVMIQVQFFQVL